MLNLILFILATIGFTHIVVDSVFFAPIRDWFKDKTTDEAIKFSKEWWYGKIGYMMTCYQCAGFWCGCFMALFLLTNTHGLLGNLLLIFAGGCASSFLANLAADYLTYIESLLK